MSSYSGHLAPLSLLSISSSRLAASSHPSPISHLRGRLYLESYEFVRSQRISCLHEGAWFLVPASQPTGKKDKHAQGQRTWRFYRLAANRKVLHYVETSERGPVRPGLEDLPERSKFGRSYRRTFGDC